MASFRINHITKYTYSAPVTDSANQVMLYPLTDLRQEEKSHELIISHNPLVETFTDYFGNQAGMFTILAPHSELIIRSIIEVTTVPVEPPVDDRAAIDQWDDLSVMDEMFPYVDFLSLENFDFEDEVYSMVYNLVNKEATPYQVAQTLSAYVYYNFNYQKGITTVETSIDEVWKIKAGVCQDFAHILLVMLRMLRIPARYVSGYICPANHELRGEGATHAWVEAYIPHYGWLGLDPTNNCIVSDRHVRLAVGRNFSDCTPVKGTFKGVADSDLEVSVSIENGFDRNTEPIVQPSFIYRVQKNPEFSEKVNSYQRFLEMQQQQQQQQQ
ncbi:MAG: transglutaminase family protein [Flavitalea sp.]